MFEVVKAFIQAGGYDLSSVLTKIDTLWVQGSLSDDQRTQLRSLAQGGATLGGSVDVLKKLEEHEQRLKALEDVQKSEGSITAAEEYAPGKWYYNGDKVLWEGKMYICTVPEGVVCTWSPADYPAYWQEVTA
ncbi:MAG: hypothetical protein IJO56_05940 [Oscillospiraceae bacterium]|nr:hypothetical protein [Oscillospiraceae bacterium]